MILKSTRTLTPRQLQFLGATLAGDIEVLDPPITDTGKTKPKKQVEEPKKYKVLLHNDNTTPFDFVVHVLQKFFQMPEARATQLMLAVHKDGIGIVAVYTKEIAETKIDAANSYAQSNKNKIFDIPMQLTFSCEPE